MSSKKINAMVLSGDGLNCEAETAKAFERVGFTVEIWHINKLLESPSSLEKFTSLAFPGGFSFGDEIASGKIQAIKFAHTLSEAFSKFRELKKPIIGICNGFQVLTHLKVFNKDPGAESEFALVHNAQGEFINKWAEIKPNFKNTCLWTRDLPESFYLPIRHGEGKLVVSAKRTDASEQIALAYTQDVNGSYGHCAGLSSLDGTVLGLMPHPEAACFKFLNPTQNTTSLAEDTGIQFFKNAYEYIKDKGIHL
ncbi:MAG: phosphoribosylformylglycinamidine synthase subunit PurQ [Halobacteriovoraceae bacterium]|nr:phosphoribosylformylglycinamidine synthase subunit PurQ [Halobacteriovoraceae bacterium]